jgi:hypothetical protein
VIDAKTYGFAGMGLNNKMHRFAIPTAVISKFKRIFVYKKLFKETRPAGEGGFNS